MEAMRCKLPERNDATEETASNSNEGETTTNSVLAHTSEAWKPKRVFIVKEFLYSRDGNHSDEANELLERGIELTQLETKTGDHQWEAILRKELQEKDFGPADLIFALPSWIEVALALRGIPITDSIDYPPVLLPFLRRKVWKSTLGAVHDDFASGSLPGKKLFVKPSTDAKSFSGTVLEGDEGLDMLSMLCDPEIFNLPKGRQTEVFCSEPVEMNSEYAVYVVNGEIQHMSHYMCRSSCRCVDRCGPENAVPLDMQVVTGAVDLLRQHEPDLSQGCRIDFALVKVFNWSSCDQASTCPDVAGSSEEMKANKQFETALVEVNDGYVSGRYPDVPVKVFVDMMIARFGALQERSKH
eukprot:TRINITY_DN32474_c0_g1_i1.p1 TRINITY_DN32474_c0_g1~~TRINITY_DN32474_c0_g1_i1.p1  ORF type:complete len:355 (-),score=47.47 TRINITY_DN32474_c0_g1_i1:668-1732(-)